MRPVALLLVIVAVSGCGGVAKQATGPPLPHPLAQRWAREADAIATADPCSAHKQAIALRTTVILAVNKRTIPQHLLEPLTSKVNALAAHNACAPVRQEAQDLAGWLRDSSG